MKSWQTTNGIHITQLLEGRSNSFLVEYGNLKILVDTAGRIRYKALKKRLKKILKNEKLEYLFLTHTHYDHAENAARIKEEFQCKIILDERESQYLSAGKSPLPAGSMLITKIIVWLGNHLTNIDKYPPATCDVCVDEIYEIKTISDPIRMLRTPGHSEGSLSLILDDEIAIVGDSMYGFSKNSVFPVFANNKSGVVESWGKLLKTNCQLFLPGHGKAISRERLEKSHSREIEKPN